MEAKNNKKQKLFFWWLSKRRYYKAWIFSLFYFLDSMKMRLAFVVVLFSIFLINTVTGDRMLKIVKFLMSHQELCGKPFSDAQWIPVLDMCEIKCDDVTEICVENDELLQQCNKLPKECSDALIASLNPPPPKHMAQGGQQWNSLPRIQQRLKQWENRQQRSVRSNNI